MPKSLPVSDQEDSSQIIRLDELAQSLPQEAFTEI